MAQARDELGRFTVAVDGDVSGAVRSLGALSRSLSDTNRSVGRFSMGLGKFTSRAGLIAGAAFAAKFLVSAGPAMGAGLMTLAAAAGVAAGGALAIGIGTKLIADEQVVKNAGTRLMDTLKSEFDHSADSMIQPVVNSLGIFTDLTKRLAPQLTQVFEASSIAIEPLAAGLAGLIENAVPGIIQLTEHSADMLIWFARALPTMGKWFSGLVDWMMKFHKPSWEIEGFFRRIGGAVLGVVDLIKGDISTSLTKAFGIHEDNPTVVMLFKLRSAIALVWGALVNNDFDGRLGKILNVQEDSPIVSVLWAVRRGLEGLAGFVTGGGTLGILYRMLTGGGGEGGGGGILAQLEPIRVGLSALVVSVQGAIERLTPMFNDIRSSLTSGLASAVPFVQETFSQLMTIIGQALEFIAAVITVVTTGIAFVWEQHGTQIKQIFTGLWRIVTSVIQGALQIISGIFDVFIGLFTGDWDRMGQGFIDIGMGLWKGVTGIFIGLFQTVKGYITIVKDVVVRTVTTMSQVASSVLETMRTYFRMGLSAIADVVRDKIGEAADYITGLRGRVIGAVSGFGNLLRSSGRELVQGLIDGIMSKINAVRDAVSSIASAIGDQFPSSPVKEGPLRSWNNGGAGLRLGEMLAEGLRKAPSVVTPAAGAMAAGVTTGTAGGVAGSGSGAAPVHVTIDMRGSIIATQKQAEDLVLGALRGLADRGVPLTIRGVRVA
jgi:phage-related protein